VREPVSSWHVGPASQPSSHVSVSLSCGTVKAGSSSLMLGWSSLQRLPVIPGRVDQRPDLGSSRRTAGGLYIPPPATPLFLSIVSVVYRTGWVTGLQFLSSTIPGGSPACREMEKARRECRRAWRRCSSGSGRRLGSIARSHGSRCYLQFVERRDKVVDLVDGHGPPTRVRFAPWDLACVSPLGGQGVPEKHHQSTQSEGETFNKDSG
jgi:hypothetical protein